MIQRQPAYDERRIPPNFSEDRAAALEAELSISVSRNARKAGLDRRLSGQIAVTLGRSMANSNGTGTSAPRSTQGATMKLVLNPIPPPVAIPAPLASTSSGMTVLCFDSAD